MGAQKIAQVAEDGMLDFTCLARQDQQAGGIAGFKRSLGDAVRRQFVVEVSGAHRRIGSGTVQPANQQVQKQGEKDGDQYRSAQGEGKGEIVALDSDIAGQATEG
jgi:hypothetical protein